MAEEEDEDDIPAWPPEHPDGTGDQALFWDESSLVYTYYLPGSIFAPPKPGSALRGMYYLAAWGALLFFRMPLGVLASEPVLMSRSTHKSCTRNQKGCDWGVIRL